MQYHKAGLNLIRQSMPLFLYCCILRAPEAVAQAPESECEMTRFRKLNLIIVSLSLLLLEHLADVVSWQSKYEHGKETFIIL